MLNNSKKPKGFTLVETIVTVAIFVIAMGVVSGVIVYSYRIHGYVFQQSLAVSEARRGIETMVKEIREARAGEDGSYLIEEAGTSTFIFYSDVDHDLEVEKVKYYVEGTDFIKELFDPVGFPPEYSSSSQKIYLSKYVRNVPPIFTYLDEEGNELAYPARKKKTKIIQVYLEINVNPSRIPTPFCLKSAVRPRNL